MGRCREDARRLGSTLRARSSPGLWVNADCHAHRSRSLSNLLANALKFTPTGGASTSAPATSGRKRTIRVEDTGVGIRARTSATLVCALRQGSAGRRDGSGNGVLRLSIFVAVAGVLHSAALLGRRAKAGAGVRVFIVELPHHRSAANEAPAMPRPAHASLWSKTMTTPARWSPPAWHAGLLCGWMCDRRGRFGLA